MKTRFVAAAVAATLAGASYAQAAPFFARGDFNDWGTGLELTDMGGGHYVGTATGLTPGARHEFKIAESDWDPAFPAGNSRVIVDDSGEITFHFYEGSFADGFEPSANRVGYDDPGHGWDVMGSFNGWSAPLDMVSQGNGIYTADLTVAVADNYEFKFRKDDDWEVNIGQTFAFNDANATFATTSPDEVVRFTLDLPGGRWDVSVIPEPGSFALLGLGSLALLRRRR